ncbi:hypothetical protein P389DRAFT_197735 [Cystobasidium minutum MCA 4210]|uniref:uncharacterized protein n=1 Tax=Cystobasidium minutum MCA 4210 TaxID=1397322 RepID=UPI0034CE2AD0|eukprot:jgi/Rhomi1/197735/gm1.5949_g
MMLSYSNAPSSYSSSFSYSSSSSPEEDPSHHLLPSADWLSMPPSSMLFDYSTGTSNNGSLDTLAYPSFESAFDYSNSQNTSLSHVYLSGTSFNTDTLGTPLTSTASTPSSLSSLSDVDQSRLSSESPLVMPTEEEYRLYELARRSNHAASSYNYSPLASEVQREGQATSPVTSAVNASNISALSTSNLPAEIASKKHFTRSANAANAATDGDMSDKYWEAVVKRNGSGLQSFWYGVTSTKIYCRPSCASRRPMRANVVFFESLDEAATAGYRPCKRCKPEDILEPSVVRQTTSVFQAATLIEESIAAHQKPPSLTQLAAQVNMSPFYFQRTFKKHFGQSPKVYAMQLAKTRLAQT